MKHVSEVIASIFDRGSLPKQVTAMQDVGPILAGSVLAWSDADRAYMHRTGRWVVWALTVRQGWGRVFEAYSAPVAAQPAITTQPGIKAA